MSLNKLMTRNVVVVDIDDRLHVVRDLFIRHKFHHLLVVDKEKRLVSVVSDRDYFKATTPHVDRPAANANDLATLHKRVHQLASHTLVTLREC